MLAIISTMALCLTLILGPGLAYSQTPPQSPVYQPLTQQTKGQGPVYQPLEQRTKGPHDRSKGQRTKSGNDLNNTILPKFPQATLPLANKSLDYPQNLSSQPQTDKNFGKKSSSQVAAQDSRKAKASAANSRATLALKPYSQSGFQQGKLSAGFEPVRRTRGAAGLEPLSGYLQDHSIGTCFDRYLQSGFSGKTRKAAASKDNRQTDKEKQQQSNNQGWGVPEKSRQNY